MKRDAIDLGKAKVGSLFKIYFVPTLLGMLSLCIVTATDGILVGHGVGPEGVAAVNIAIAPFMLLVGFGLMLGMGCSVVASIQLSRGADKAARLNVVQALVAVTIVLAIFMAWVYASPTKFSYLLGSSDKLLPLVRDYLVWLLPGEIFSLWAIIGLFIIRLDGSPKLAMWLNIIPGALNAILDYIFIFPLDMGIKGAAIATAISYALGGIAVIVYLAGFATKLKLIAIKLSRKSLMLMGRNLGYQCRVGVSALLGEMSMGVIMFTGNQIFMEYLGDAGVGAFGIACYYCPFIFMIGNAIAQSAQPIISYNYGMGQLERVRSTERLAILTALGCGVAVTAMFLTMPKLMVALFIDPAGHAAQIAIEGMPLFATAVICYIFNLTAIGYFQSVERVSPSIVFALLRGFIFIVPAFIVMPHLLGVTGIWLALGVSEMLTTLCIVAFYFCGRKLSR